MGNKKISIAVTIVGLVSLVVGITAKLILSSNIAGFSPRGFGEFTMICFLLSINLLLLEKKSSN